jgi:hypothetical protein
MTNNVWLSALKFIFPVSSIRRLDRVTPQVVRDGDVDDILLSMLEDGKRLSLIPMFRTQVRVVTTAVIYQKEVSDESD